MKRVLFVITKGDVGGAQKYVADLAAHLDPQKFSAEILYGGTPGVRFLSNAVRPYFLFLNDIAAVIELAFTFHRKQPDFIHLNSSKTGVLGALAARLASTSLRESRRARLGWRRAKVIFTAHGWVFNPTNALSPLRRKCYILLHRFAARMTDAIINVSEYDRALAIKEKIAPPEKLVTIWNGIDPDNLLPRDAARKEIGRISRIGRIGRIGRIELIGQVWIGSVGRLTQEKNYETFIDAAAQIKDPRCAFFIIGDGAKRTALKSQITNYKLQNRVFIIPGIAHAARYLKAFDVFVLPSIKEGLPYTILEAMHAGVPIAATEVGGMPEILRGRGTLVPPRDPNALAETIRRALANSEETRMCAEKAREFARKELTLERMVAETERIYLTRGGPTSTD